MKLILTLLIITFSFSHLSSQGIKLVSDISSGQASTFDFDSDYDNGILGKIDQTVYFYAFYGGTYKIWSTENGTQTVNVVFEKAVENLNSFLFLGNKLFFVADYEDLYIIENGQSAKLLVSNNEYTTDLLSFKNKLYFVNDDVLTRYNSATSSMEKIFEFGSFGGIRDMVVVGEKLMIIGADTDGDTKIFNSTGEPGGTIPFYVLNTGSEFSRDINMTAVNDKCFFWYHPNNDPYNLYVTDGTEAGTKLLKAFKAFSFTDLKKDRSILPFNGKLYFRGETSEDGDNLFVSDGTEAGTKMFYNPNSAGYDSTPKNLMVYNNKLYFTVKNEAWNRSIHVFNGSKTEKANLGNFSYNGGGLNLHDGKLIFSGSKTFDVDEIFISNGTNTGTTQLTFGSTAEQSLSPYDLLSVDKSIYFIGSKKETGTELYYYNPTLTGIKTLEEKTFSLAPNPASNYIEIIKDNQIELENTHAYIYNSSGILISVRQIKNNKLPIDDLLSGIYSINIINNKANYNGRFVKQ